MTIQNIQDVMLRIMSLNRNLTTQSLQTLLSASGWDKEDIEEGLRIFKDSSQNTFQSVPPIQNTQINPITPMHQDVTEDTNAFTPPLGAGGTEVEVSPSPVVVNKEEVKEEVIEVTPPVNHHTGLIIILISIFVLIVLGGLYFYLQNQEKPLDPEYLSQENTNAFTPPLKTEKTEEPEIINESEDNDVEFVATSSGVKVSLPIKNISIASSSTVIKSDNSNPNPELKKLREEILEAQKEIADLKLAIQKLSAFKSVGTVKYISQKGPIGKTGKGILSVEATSTGFLINYTDKTKAVIPFSTTTILNIINAQALCLNSSTSTQSLNTNCLDQESLYRLLIK